MCYAGVRIYKGGGQPGQPDTHEKNIDEFIFHDVNTTHSANMRRELNDLSSDFFSLVLA